MRFPFIFRASHDEIVAELRREIADRKEEARRFMDLFAQRATGEKMFYPDPVLPEAPKEPRNMSDMTLIEQAKYDLGPRAGVRQAIQYAESKSKQEYERDHSTAIPAEMSAVMDEGRAAGQKVTA